ncbi:FtsX-like permease family protein [Streptomyces sp. NPDC046215]|uniref:ABC transporter permease n=1 Tax=Streptomyces stramineus TaxID=173861 RepID=A0ABN1ATS7_9ACTN
MSARGTERAGHGPADRPTGPTGAAAWARDLTSGARFAFTGGRESWLRTALTALGVGLGVTLLMIATAVPEMLSERHERSIARLAPDMPAATIAPGPATLLHRDAATDYRDQPIGGALLRPDGPRAPAPPGVDRIPGPGEMVVSPALSRLLDSPDGKLLRERFPQRVVGTIGDAGLIGPSELYYYAGSDRITTGTGAERIDHYGQKSDGFLPQGPVYLILMIMMCVVLLMPVVVFIATAVRFGSENRDRRLAALRLVGADIRTVRRIASGEALCGSLVGLAVGVGIFLSVRELATRVTVKDTTVFPSDMAPSPLLGAIIAIAVPASAVLVTLFALRGVAVEPLGVVRDAVAPRRRLWWRLLFPAAGVALLLPLLSRASGPFGTSADPFQLTASAVLILVGVAAVLPWLVETCVARLRGGPPSWQLAVRRLQLHSGAAARTVSGITVAMAGAIAVQMLFAGTQGFTEDTDGVPPTHSQMRASYRPVPAAEVRGYTERFRATPGVVGALGVVTTYADRTDKAADERGVTSVSVGDCATLREMARLDSCADGDVFVARKDGGFDTARAFPPGTGLTMEEYAESARDRIPRVYRWTVPASARVVATRPDPAGEHHDGILATPSAVDITKMPEAETVLMVKSRPGDLDALERVRNTAAGIDPGMHIRRMGGVVKVDHYTAIERGLLIGSALTLAVIGASMLVSMLEQLRDRRRMLSVLVAFGTRRSTVAWSVLWQTAIPVALGLVLAVLGGLGLGWAMLELAGGSVKDWLVFLPVIGGGAAVTLLVTLVSLPLLWRLMRADGLREE